MKTVSKIWLCSLLISSVQVVFSLNPNEAPQKGSSDHKEGNQFCYEFESNETQPEQQKTGERAGIKLGGTYQVGLSFLYDDALFEGVFQGNKTALDEYILTSLLEVQFLYSQADVKRIADLRFVLTELKRVTELDVPTGMGENMKIIEGLRRYRSNRLRNPPDLTYLLTGANIWEHRGGKIELNVLGTALIAGICSANSGFGVVEASNQRMSHTLAHELGHSFSLRHDGDSNTGTEDCEPDQFIMASNDGPGRRRWSSCSLNQLKNFLKNQAFCLNGKTHKPVSEFFDLSRYKGITPGDLAGADRQCSTGTGSTQFKPVDSDAPGSVSRAACSRLKCRYGPIELQLNAALEGTPCDRGTRKCYLADCVSSVPSI